MPEGQVLEFTHVTKRFSDVTAVSDFSARIEPGVVTAFLGPNGAGKTTTLRILLGQLKATSGTATIGGTPYAELRQPLRTIGAVLEETSYRPRRTANRQLAIAAKANGIPLSRIDEVLALVGLDGEGDTRIGGYSLGMRQRLSVATALLGDPGALVFDEPANGLDPEGIRWMRLLMRRLADEGRTVLVSSHVLSEVEQVADHVLVLSKGQLVLSSGIEDLADPAGGAVIVDADDRGALRSALASAGFEVEVLRSGLTVRGGDAATVGAVAAQAGIALSTLLQRGPTLEDVFIDLVRGGRLEPRAEAVASQLVAPATTAIGMIDADADDDAVSPEDRDASAEYAGPLRSRGALPVLDDALPAPVAATGLSGDAHAADGASSETEAAPETVAPSDAAVDETPAETTSGADAHSGDDALAALLGGPSSEDDIRSAEDGAATAEDPADEAPVAEDSVSDSALDELPADDTSADDRSGDDRSAAEGSVDEARSGDNAADEAPADETPAGDNAADEAPADETPAGDITADEAPADETPAGDIATDEAPADETPAGDIATDEAPAEEASDVDIAVLPEEEPSPLTPSSGEERPSSEGEPAVELATDPTAAEETTAEGVAAEETSDSADGAESEDEDAAPRSFDDILFGTAAPETAVAATSGFSPVVVAPEESVDVTGSEDDASEPPAQVAHTDGMTEDETSVAPEDAPADGDEDHHGVEFFSALDEEDSETPTAEEAPDGTTHDAVGESVDAEPTAEDDPRSAAVTSMLAAAARAYYDDEPKDYPFAPQKQDDAQSDAVEPAHWAVASTGVIDTVPGHGGDVDVAPATEGTVAESGDTAPQDSVHEQGDHEHVDHHDQDHQGSEHQDHQEQEHQDHDSGHDEHRRD